MRKTLLTGCACLFSLCLTSSTAFATDDILMSSFKLNTLGSNDTTLKTLTLTPDAQKKANLEQELKNISITGLPEKKPANVLPNKTFTLTIPGSTSASTDSSQIINVSPGSVVNGQTITIIGNDTPTTQQNVPLKKSVLPDVDTPVQNSNQTNGSSALSTLPLSPLEVKPPVQPEQNLQKTPEIKQEIKKEALQEKKEVKEENREQKQKNSEMFALQEKKEFERIEKEQADIAQKNEVKEETEKNQEDNLGTTDMNFFSEEGKKKEETSIQSTIKNPLPKKDITHDKTSGKMPKPIKTPLVKNITNVQKTSTQKTEKKEEVQKKEQPKEPIKATQKEKKEVNKPVKKMTKNIPIKKSTSQKKNTKEIKK